MKKRLYNPLTQDVSTTYDINKDANPVSFTVKAGEIAEFEEPVFSHLQKYLATAIMNVRGVKEHSNYDRDYKEVLQEIVI